MADSIYAQGTAVWYDDKELGWTDGVVTSTEVNGKDVTITLSNERQGKPVVVRTSLDAIANNDRKLPPLRNAPEFDDVEDLASIPHLNEPSLLRVIQARYAQEKIYTFSGIVLVAVNPFTKVPLYGADAIKKYSGKSRENLEPHLFSIAEETYTAMRQTRRSQTVIISGESGAGKTESAKYIMRYLASVSERASGGGASTVERRILATNPILEAFGNAKTMRNDNSSRFGKYIQILFDESHTIVGARIQTYLLERARISSLQLVRGERTYHIFYQLVAGASAAEREPLSLNRPASEFSFLAGGSFDQDAEAKNFQTTKHALSTIGITDHQMTSVFTLLAGLLHLGNVEIRQYHTSPDAILDETEPSLITAMNLLGIDLKEFRKWTTQKFFAARGENIRSVRTVAQARSVRDGVAKFIYACIFDWLITKVNSRLETNESMTKEQAFIAVLDIYGFEHFERNSFEQFCINYANEKLQHQFTSHVFKIQQKEYASEDINWQSIEFSDNQPTIDLIEGRLGILSILDEESRLAAGADTTFIEKLNWQLLGSTGGKASANFRSTPDSFTVKHYAHSVEYDVEGFLEKNRATVPEEHLELILKSTNMFLRAVVETSINSGKRAMESRAPTPPPMMAASVPSTPRKMRPMSGIGVQNLVANLTNGLDRVHHGPKGGAGARKPTQCSIFRSSLKLLMDTLVQTDIHYIRCIKPNENREAWALDPALTLAQLRACGVLETVRISLSGYPNRKTYEEFCSRCVSFLTQ
ncbi:hypothetical protein CYLTODRAFT_432472 [Cylindrobasidium torrendii FP15055 ss-10]|uniref:Myosin motor domain-containing protein n=1 Tax=Cylindrobasidium torrendii FP15055 ss-10 TaxID=1314674 RepID=A0A0D7B3P7_9AGAR|nr:hypothetical protein CYLTODRAFT_432472 [Cylindrobasidium torrendii FP15055 ss-10]